MTGIIANGIDILPYILEITEYCAKKGWNIKPYPKVIISKTKEYVSDIIGKTGYYDINNDTITLITAGRHPIDICKTYIHELVHYKQKRDGIFTDEILKKMTGEKYMEESKELEKIEKEAYLLSGFIFREWRDTYK